MDKNTSEKLKQKAIENEKSEIPMPIRSDGHGANDLGPRNVLLDTQNPDMYVPPATDHGLVPNLKFSFGNAHMKIEPGGWSREVTERELPISKTFAAINMCLGPNIREMHYHQQSEWCYMLVGSARITAVDEMGRNFVADVHQGEGWLFPKFIPHSIQGLENGCEFLLMFDKGNYSEDHTFSMSQLLSLMPKDVLSANFGVSEDAFNTLPGDEIYMTEGENPGTIESQTVESPYGKVPQSFKHSLINVEPIVSEGGSIRILDSHNFPISKTVAAALVEVKPGAMREIHWHANNDEFQYYISGHARMTVYLPDGKARTFNFGAGDCGYVPVGGAHYVQNIGEDTLWFLEIFNSDHFSDISLAQWMALTPKELLKTVLDISPEFYNSLNKERCGVVKYKGFEFPKAKSTPQNKCRF